MESAIKYLADNTENMIVPDAVIEEALHMRRLNNLHEELQSIERERGLSKASLRRAERLRSAREKESMRSVSPYKGSQNASVEDNYSSMHENSVEY